jgi:hypothetical protein
MSEQLLSFFIILSIEQLLIYNTYRFAISSINILRYLSIFHKQIPAPIRRVLSQESLILNFPDPSLIPISVDPIPIIPCLELKHDIRYIICYQLSDILKSHKEYYRKEYRDPDITSQGRIP